MNIQPVLDRRGQQDNGYRKNKHNHKSFSEVSDHCAVIVNGSALYAMANMR